MGNKFIWQDRFNIGVDIIDKEHRKLFSIMNRLISFSEQEDKMQWVCQEGIKYFKDHAMKHFSEEELYMASINYRDYEMHRHVHDNFRRKTLPALERELEQTEFSKESVSHFLGVCAGWLIGHTLTEDRAITGKAVSRWGDLLPEEQQIEMSQLISYLLKDMFQLNPQIISERYGGEKFGEGIYYRLVFAGEEKEKWELLLVFEDRLLISTVGSILGAKSEKLTPMVLNASRYAARQFAERVKEHFSNAEKYELQDENLLSFEQFQKIFDKQRPQCSLLYNTGEGYFAFCAMVPQKMSEADARSLVAENAMLEVKKYLKQNEKEKESRKKKILVVDDSKVVCKTMEELLGKDYQVSVASSGLASIRSIILDRPDLVLLDYEMPVCNGMQVLEMIRSEKDLVDLPVIFLTSKVDKESVNKVMKLKPEGYLLKTLKPEVIKKNVDAYFRKQAG